MTQFRPRTRTSVSEVQCWVECNLKRYYRYVYELDLPKKLTGGSNAFGNTIHKAMEMLYQGHDYESVINITREAAKKERMFPDEASCAVAVMCAYMDVIGTEDWTIIGAEYWWEYAPAKAYGFDRGVGMKLDLIVQDNKMDYWVVDHKTSKWVVRDDVVPVIEKAKLQYQAAVYTKAARDHMIPVKGIIYNIICQPRYRRSKKETREAFESRVYDLVLQQPEKYFTRGHQEMTEEQVTEVILGFASKATAMDNDMEAHPNAASCMYGFQHKCEYFDECHNTPWDYQLENKKPPTEDSSTDGKELESHLGPPVQVDLSL